MKKIKNIVFTVLLVSMVGMAVINGILSAVDDTAPVKSSRGTSNTNMVTLRAAPGNTIVQMFPRLDDDTQVKKFDDGTRCEKLQGPIPVHISGGGVIDFYHLSCNGASGYVNAQWVR
jgi:hypothetical protein